MSTDRLNVEDLRYHIQGEMENEVERQTGLHTLVRLDGDGMVVSVDGVERIRISVQEIQPTLTPAQEYSKASQAIWDAMQPKSE